MYALILNDVVTQVSEETYPVTKPLYWLEVTKEHGMVTPELLYIKEEDRFVEARMIYAKNPDTHTDYLYLSFDPVPDTHSIQVRDQWSHWDDDTESFVRDMAKVEASLEVERNRRLETLSEKCGKDIIGGFESDASGELASYRCNENDQMRMLMASISSTGGGIWVGNKYKPHTQEQARGVLAHAHAHINGVTMTYSDNCERVREASIDEIYKLNF